MKDAAARFVLHSKLAIALLLVAAACTRGAAPLPADRSSINARPAVASDFSQADLALTCEQIETERSTLSERAAEAEKVVLADRQRNQIAGYFAALFILPIVAVDTHQERLSLITMTQMRLDTLRDLSRYRSC